MKARGASLISAMRSLSTLSVLLFTTFVACSSGCTEASTSQAPSTCSVGADGKCAATDPNGNTFCDVDHGPTNSRPDAAFFLVCAAGEVCAVKDNRLTFSCCIPASDCLPGYAQSP
jgi:hypothetical protein